MKFQYHNPIKFIFGEDAFEQIGTICKDHKVMLVYGGASAMDTGKAIAFGAVHENLEDYIEGRKEADGRHLLNIVIPTYPSTGSEANGICDIMEYKGYGTELFGAWPDYCLMNPSVTMSLDLKNTAYSVMGCFIQTASWYIGNHQNDIAKGFSKTVLKVLLESMERLSEDFIQNNLEEGDFGEFSLDEMYDMIAECYQ